MSEVSLSAVDIEEVLDRLVLYAQNLSAGAVCIGLNEVVLPGGDGAKDLAMTTIKKFLDPQDSSVRWSESREPPTTSTLLTYLRKVLERDFLDLLKSKSYRNVLYPETAGAGEDQNDGSPAFTLDQFAGAFETPEGEALRQERVKVVLSQFDSVPDLKEIVELQLDPNGYNAFTNQELAVMLNTDVADIEKRKKRIKRKLRKLAVQNGLEGNHV